MTVIEKLFNEIHELESKYFLKNYTQNSYTFMREEVIKLLSKAATNASYSEAVPKAGAVAESRKDKLYRTAIQIYGAENQMNQLIEECAELIQSVNKYRRKGSENILEEVADVEIMIEQTKMILGEELTKIIEIHKENKLDRLAGKLSLKATASL